MKKILVTGAAGFIGSRFALSALEQGYEVWACDELSYFESRTEHVWPKSDRLKFIDREAGLHAEVDAIVHLGACARTTEFDKEFLDRVNVRYSQSLWNWATAHKIPMVYASSAATYGDGAQGYDDDESRFDELKPLNPYGESKRIFDQWVLKQEKSGHCPPSWSGFKFFNVYGFGERHKMGMSSVVIQAFDQIQAKGSLKLFRSHKAGIADGEQKRDFIAVEDLISVIWFALQKPIKRGVFNLGTGKARSFLDLGRAVFAALGREAKIDFVDTPIEIRDKYQYFTQANMSKLLKEGYSKPFMSLESGVQAYIQKLLKS